MSPKWCEFCHTATDLHLSDCPSRVVDEQIEDATAHRKPGFDNPPSPYPSERYEVGTDEEDAA